MSDVSFALSNVPEAQSVAALFATLQLSPDASILLVQVPDGMVRVVQAAAKQLGVSLVLERGTDSTPALWEAQMAEIKPAVVVCSPEMFGWMSKLAFLNGAAAIYTCGEAGEGTLLFRASHF